MTDDTAREIEATYKLIVALCGTAPRYLQKAHDQARERLDDPQADRERANATVCESETMES